MFAKHNTSKSKRIFFIYFYLDIILETKDEKSPNLGVVYTEISAFRYWKHTWTLCHIMIIVVITTVCKITKKGYVNVRVLRNLYILELDPRLFVGFHGKLSRINHYAALKVSSYKFYLLENVWISSRHR